MNKKQMIIVGVGGHAQSVVEVLSEPRQPYEIVGILDDQYKEIVSLQGIPLLGDIAMAEEVFSGGIRSAFIALGSNSERKAISEKLSRFYYPAVVSSHALISKTAFIGSGSIIMPGTCLRVGVCVGAHCIVNTNACVDHESVLGDYVHIAPGSELSGKVVIGEGVFLGTGSRVIDRMHIGEWTTVGAGGGTVVKSLPDHVLAVGTPARIIKTIEGERI